MERVLIVDDQVYFCEMARDILGKHCAFTVVGEAQDAQQALELVGQVDPDVVLMDIEMEGMNGLQATHLIRSQFPEVRVVLMSIYDEKEYGRLALRVGAQAFISKKDFSAPTLAEILNLESPQTAGL